jgi:hypothetical protein
MKFAQYTALFALWIVTTGMLAPETVFGASTAYMLGATKVTLNEYGTGSGSVYFAPHSNETTAVAAAKSVVAKSGGRVYWLTHGDGARNITFKIGKTKYTVDPNRIFSDAGARASLKPYSPEAFTAVRMLAAFVIRGVFAGGVRPLVGIHNNTNGSLSVVSYASDPAAVETSQGKGRDPDDFFFVTRLDYFNALKRKGFNVVLQSAGPPEDGSLSVYAAHAHVPYINVEAQAGHLKQQVEMLKALQAL